MITVHHLNKSRSTRVIWLLEELGMPYEIVHHQRDPITSLAPESLRLIHPLSKAPIIVDTKVVDTKVVGEATDKITLCESGAIMEYILNQATAEQLRPAQDSSEYYHYVEWLHFAEGSLALPVITKLIMSMETRDGSQPLDHYIAKELALDFSYIEQTLSQRPYFAGNSFTAADIMMAVMLTMADNLALLEDKPQIKAYLANVKLRKAYQVAISYE